MHDCPSLCMQGMDFTFHRAFDMARDKRYLPYFGPLRSIWLTTTLGRR